MCKINKTPGNTCLFQLFVFPPGCGMKSKLCLLFAGNCIKANETEQTLYTSRSRDIIHARLLHQLRTSKKGLLKKTDL